MKVAKVVTIFAWFISSTAGQQVLELFTCSSEGVQCDHHGGSNLLDTVMHVAAVEECRQLCLQDEDCRYISYFDASAFPASNLCQLFSSCDSLTQCSGCVSENRNCFQTCGSNVVGSLDENVLELFPSIESEVKCKEKCLNNPECSFYTFFFPNDTVFYNYCFLLAELAPPAQPCTSCTTAPADCSAPAPCRLSVAGAEHQQLLLNTSLATTAITVTGGGGGACALTFLLVGGGGLGTYAGGGSGYLEYRAELQVAAGTEMTARVGDPGQETLLSLGSRGTFTAAPGQDGEYNDGGDGYSGGGGYGDTGGKPNGGTDGGDGEGAGGGAGSGADLATCSLAAWSLAAGAGGGYLDSFGGGGGGVLVDGAGPGTGGYPGGYQGQGYGGGGSGLTPSSINIGFQGVILLEISEAADTTTTEPATTTTEVATTTFASHCEDLCSNATSNEYVGDRCSTSYCFCGVYGVTEYSCPADLAWCQDNCIEDCVTNCANSEQSG